MVQCPNLGPPHGGELPENSIAGKNMKRYSSMAKCMLDGFAGGRPEVNAKGKLAEIVHASQPFLLWIPPPKVPFLLLQHITQPQQLVDAN